MPRRINPVLNMRTCAARITTIRPPRWCSSQILQKGTNMLNQQTIEKLHDMKLHGMADAFHTQLETTDTGQRSFEERFALLVDQQWLWRENRALARRLRFAHLKERGVIEDVDYQHPRGLDRKLMRTLATIEWVRQHQNLLLLGPTDPATLCPSLPHD